MTHHGGKHPGPGRPRLHEAKRKNFTFHASKETGARIKDIGRGSLTDGIRVILGHFDKQRKG